MPEKILIVDDDLDTLKLIGLMLQRQGYEIAVANNGAQGLAKAAAERPNLILLDVMMPDMDGYEVTRRLRSDPNLVAVPIIMFTAKTLVDDKVAGFEAGVDDYLTKPTHPAELASRVKALLQRSATARAAPVERGRVIGFLGAKGGLGTTTLALNVGVALAEAGEDAIALDMRPGQGMMGLLLGFTRASGVGALLSKTVGEINARAIEGQLVPHRSGLKLLLSSAIPSEATLENSLMQAEQLVRQATTLCKTLVLDLGSGLGELQKRMAVMCDQVVIAVEPQRVTLLMAKNLLADLDTLGVGTGRVDLVMMNRMRSSLQTSWQQAEQILGHPIGTIITPAPELAYQAAENGAPIIDVQPDSVTADQIRKLAQKVVQVQKAKSAAGGA